MNFHLLGSGSLGVLLAFHLRRTLPQTSHITVLHKTLSGSFRARERGTRICVETGGVKLYADPVDHESFESVRAESENRIERLALTAKRTRLGRKHPKARPLPTLESLSRDTEIKSLIVTTKGYWTLAAFKRLLPRITPDTTVVLMHNGLAVHDALVREIFINPSQRPHFIIANSTHQAWVKRLKTWHIVHHLLGSIRFGVVPDPRRRDFEASLYDESVDKHSRSLSLGDLSNSVDTEVAHYDSLRQTAEALLNIRLSVSWSPVGEVQTILRQRMVANAILGPITALLGCRYGDIYGSSRWNYILRAICQEAANVFAAQFEDEATQWLEATAMNRQSGERESLGRVPPQLTAPELARECRRISQFGQGTISSMLSDVRRGSRTDVDYVNGYLLNLGKAYEVPMPVTATLHNLLKMRTEIPLDQVF